MKKDINKRTLWTGFLKPATEAEIQEAANTMKDGKAYLFKNEDGLLEIYNKRHPGEYAERHITFIRKIIAA